MAGGALDERMVDSFDGVEGGDKPVFGGEFSVGKGSAGVVEDEDEAPLANGVELKGVGEVVSISASLLRRKSIKA